MKALVMLFAFLSFGSFASPTLILYTEEYPPYNYSELGRIKGINTEIIREACRMAELTCKFEILPWTRAYKQVQEQQNSGIFSAFRTTERERKFKWVGPLETSQTGLFKLKSRTEVQGENLAALSKYSVGIVKDSIARTVITESGWDKPKNIIVFAKANELIPPFLAGRLDLIPGSSLSLPFELKDSAINFEDLEMMYEVEISTHKLFIAFNLNTDNRAILKLQQQITKLRKSRWTEALKILYQRHVLSE